MSGLLTDYRLFWREFRENFHTTGAILPSGRPLARALSRFVAGGGPTARRILEVGPGTGAVTAAIIPLLPAHDRLDLVELNPRFVERLKQRFVAEPAFQAVSSRARVLHQAVEELPAAEPYDVIVSGLPLNNFSVEAVETIVLAFRRLLRPGGTLSFFEYIAIRSARAAVSGRDERTRLRGIGRVLGDVLVDEVARDCVWRNVPPAWVHHVRLNNGNA